MEWTVWKLLLRGAGGKKINQDFWVMARAGGKKTSRFSFSTTSRSTKSVPRRAESLMLYRIVVQVNRIQNARPAVFDQPRSHDERTRWKAAGRRPSQGGGRPRQRAGAAGSSRNRRAAARIYAADHARSERTSRPA